MKQPVCRKLLWLTHVIQAGGMFCEMPPSLKMKVIVDSMKQPVSNYYRFVYTDLGGCFAKCSPKI